MNPPANDPIRDYALHGRVTPQLEARLREDSAARAEFVDEAALDAALSHYFTVVEPPMLVRRSRAPRESFVRRIAALLVVALGAGVAAGLWLRVREAPWPALAASRPLPAPPAAPPGPPPPAPVAAAARIGRVRGAPAWIGRAGAVRPGDAIAPGEGLALAAGDACEAHLPDGTIVRLLGGSAARFLGGAHDDVRLDRGVLEANVRPRPADGLLHLGTPQARIVVRGTVLRLTTEPDRTRVEVSSGAVECRPFAGEGGRLVRAGEQATVRGAVVYVSRDARFRWIFRSATQD